MSNQPGVIPAGIVQRVVVSEFEILNDGLAVDRPETADVGSWNAAPADCRTRTKVDDREITRCSEVGIQGARAGRLGKTAIIPFIPLRTDLEVGHEESVS